MRRIMLVGYLIVGVLLLAACSTITESGTTPDTGDEASQPAVTMPESVEINTDDDVPRVTAKEAKQLVDSGLAVIVDSRSQEAYDDVHIAGSEPRPTVALSQLGEVLDPEQLIITYCT